MRPSNTRRLTLPSRGQLPGYALQLPLMSNVRRQQTRPVRQPRNKCQSRGVSTAYSLGQGRRGRCAVSLSPRCPPASAWAARPASLAVSTPSSYRPESHPAVQRTKAAIPQCVRIQDCRLRRGSKSPIPRAFLRVIERHLVFQSQAGTMHRRVAAAECRRLSALRRPADKAKTMPVHMNPPRPVPQVVIRKQEGHVNTPPPNPSIEGTASGLRPPAAPHVKR